MVGEVEEALSQINGTPINGATSKKDETKMVRAEQRWIYDLQLLERFTRDKDPRYNLCATLEYI